MAGFSFGGQIAGLSAALLGDRVRALTLIGVAALGLRADPREPFAKQRPGMSAAEVAAVFRQNLEVLMFANPANIDALAVHLQGENIKRARFRSRPFAPTDNLARALEKVTAPLKTIWGTRDIIARPSIEARLEILRRHHPELAVRLIEGAGHWVAYEAARRVQCGVSRAAKRRGEPWGQTLGARRLLGWVRASGSDPALLHLIVAAALSTKRPSQVLAVSMVAAAISLSNCLRKSSERCRLSALTMPSRE